MNAYEPIPTRTRCDGCGQTAYCQSEHNVGLGWRCEDCR